MPHLTSKDINFFKFIFELNKIDSVLPRWSEILLSIIHSLDDSSSLDSVSTIDWGFDPKTINALSSA